MSKSAEITVQQEPPEDDGPDQARGGCAGSPMAINILLLLHECRGPVSRHFIESQFPKSDAVEVRACLVGLRYRKRVACSGGTLNGLWSLTAKPLPEPTSNAATTLLLAPAAQTA